MDLCGGPAGQMLSREEEEGGVQEAVSDRRGPLTDKWATRPEGEPPGADFSSSTVCDGSRHHNCAVMGRPRLSIRRSKWSERRVHTVTSPRRAQLINWSARTSGSPLIQIWASASMMDATGLV